MTKKVGQRGHATHRPTGEEALVGAKGSLGKTIIKENRLKQRGHTRDPTRPGPKARRISDFRAGTGILKSYANGNSKLA